MKTRNETNRQTFDLTYQTPPNSVNFEKMIIGVILIEKNALNRVFRRFGKNETIFYQQEHREIYKAVCYLADKGIPVDLLSVIQELQRRGTIDKTGGDKYLVDLTISVSSSAHLDYYLLVVLEKYIARQMIDHCRTTIEALQRGENDIFDEIDRHTEKINEIEEIIVSQKDAPTSQELHQELIQLQREKRIQGIPSKHRSVEKRLNGWRNGNLIIVGARPAMGKTTFVLDDVFHTAKNGTPVGFFSLEMSALELHTKMVSNDTEISGNRFRDMNLSPMELERVFSTSTFDKLPFYIEENTSELNKILAKARLMHKEKGVKIIVIDYLQLIELPYTKGMTENTKISIISRKLKLLAKELKIPIIVISQLSRNAEQRPSKRPQLSDLRDSGAIEQDADIVVFLYRPEYYKIATWDRDWDGENDLPTKNEVEVIFAKFRGGGVFEERLKFRGDLSKFYDLYTDFGTYQNPVPVGDPSTAFDDDDEFKY